MSSNLHSVIADAEGDMRKVYDLALILHEHLSDADPMSLDMQHALSWPASDLLQAGLALRKSFETMFDLSASGRTEPAPAPMAGTPFIDPAMISHPRIGGDPLDELCLIRDELRVVWLALGNPDEAEAYLIDIREHVNGIANRVDEIVKAASARPSGRAS